MTDLTNEELKVFSEQLAQRYMSDIEGYLIKSSFRETPYNVRLIPLPSADDVSKIQFSDMKKNEIYFYTESLNNSIFHLLRHFRNCASHKGRIKKTEIGGVPVYLFEDKTKVYVSMIGNVEVNLWEKYIKELYDIAIKNRKIRKIKKSNKDISR